MLKNTQDILGKKGKELDKLFKQYNDLTSQIKDLTTTKAEVTERIKELCETAGLFETSNYVCLISEVAGRQIVDSAKLKDLYPTAYVECSKFTNPTVSIKYAREKNFI